MGSIEVLKGVLMCCRSEMHLRRRQATGGQSWINCKTLDMVDSVNLTHCRRLCVNDTQAPCQLHQIVSTLKWLMLEPNHCCVLLVTLKLKFIIHLIKGWLGAKTKMQFFSFNADWPTSSPDPRCKTFISRSTGGESDVINYQSGKRTISCDR